MSESCFRSRRTGFFQIVLASALISACSPGPGRDKSESLTEDSSHSQGPSTSGNEIQSVGPGKAIGNANCRTPRTTGLATGALACYGIWVIGTELGADTDKCAADGTTGSFGAPGIGCEISTLACTSGKAEAIIMMNIHLPWDEADDGVPPASDDDVVYVGQDFEVTPAVLREKAARVWVYKCL